MTHYYEDQREGKRFAIIPEPQKDSRGKRRIQGASKRDGCSNAVALSKKKVLNDQPRKVQSRSD